MRKSMKRNIGVGLAGLSVAAVTGFSSAQASTGGAKNYGHCVYDGSTARGCTSGTWWDDGTNVYDRTYWRYVSGPNSTYHVTYFQEEAGSWNNDTERTAETKSKTNLTARFDWTPYSITGFNETGYSVFADVCEDQWMSPDHCRTAGEEFDGSR